MWFDDVSDRNAVLDAINEFNRRGRDNFLHEHGFRRARTYFVLHDGGYYDAKPILFAAYKHQFPDRDVPSHASNGTIHTVAPKLESLEFKVVRSDEIATSSTHKKS